MYVSISLSLYTYIYIYICICVCTYIYIYIYIYLFICRPVGSRTISPRARDARRAAKGAVAQNHDTMLNISSSASTVHRVPAL